MPEQDLRAIIPGASALIKALCDELQMAQVIDAAVRWDPRQCKLSPGTRIVALVVNALVHREPLYHVKAFYAGQDVALLFGPGVQAGDLNDDALARALDALAEANPSAFFSQIALDAVLRRASRCAPCIRTRPPTPCTAPTRPIPRSLCTSPTATPSSHRPDLKQMVFGLLAQAQGLSVAAGVHDGNQSDKVWNGWVPDQYERLLAGYHRESLLYMADCQFVTKEWGRCWDAGRWASTSSWRSATATSPAGAAWLSIARKVELDGFHVLRTNVPVDRMETPKVRATYKSLRCWSRTSGPQHGHRAKVEELGGDGPGAGSSLWRTMSSSLPKVLLPDDAGLTVDTPDLDGVVVQAVPLAFVDNGSQGASPPFGVIRPSQSWYRNPAGRGKEFSLSSSGPGMPSRRWHGLASPRVIRTE